jgi:hypothetical protein
MSISQKSNGHQSGPDSNPRTEPVSHENPLFIYIRIPGDIDPEDRWEKFAHPLQQALEKDDLGEVTGGGTQFSEPDENGEDFVEFCGIDVDVYDAAKGLPLLRRELIRLQAPPGTMLLYELDGCKWEDPVYRRES